MNQDRKSEHSDPMSDLEIRRIESEIAKNRAEEKKLTAETQEVERRLSQKWYSGVSLAKWVAGGIVLAGLLAAWIIGYFQPILQKEQEVTKLENKRLAEENLLQKQENDKQLKVLAAENDTLKGQIALAVSQAVEQQLAWKELSNEYRQLANKQQITEEEKARFATMATKADKESDSLKSQINQLKSAQIAVKERAEKLASDISKIPKLFFLSQTQPRKDSHTNLILVRYGFRSQPSGGLRDVLIKMKFDGVLEAVDAKIRGAFVEEYGTRISIDVDSSGFSYSTGYLREGNDIVIEVISKKELNILSMHLSP
jgi:hypothetical protein